MPDGTAKPPGQSRSEGKTSYVTSAVGLEVTAGRLRARRASLFTQTIIWVTGLICLAFLLGTLIQAWSNSQLAQDLQQQQQQVQQLRIEHNNLEQQARDDRDPYVIESEARLQLGYSSSGEHVVVVVNPSNQGQVHPTSPASNTGAPGFWQTWWNTFFGNG